MDAIQYLEALRKRWLVIVAFVVLGLIGGAVFASAQPVLYESTSSVYVASNGGDTTAEALQGGTFAQDIAQSYVSLATKPAVLDKVIARLGLHETSGQLAKRIDAELTVNTVIINVTATDRSPQTAARIANATTSALESAASTLSTTDRRASIVLHPVGQASAPSSPSSPNVPFILLSGLGLGLVVGLAYALGRQLLDTRISGDDQLRATPGLERTPFLGSVSHRRGKVRVADVLRSEPHGLGAEEYRRLVTNLEFAGIDHRIRSVTVTSALAGDGKTTTSLNLATAAAERRQRVLLIDADLRRPTVAEYLGIDGGVGLTNVLLGSATPSQAIQRSGEIDVLPSGVLPPNVTQLVTSEAMGRFFAELLMRYDFVVVDAPPLLPVVDALTFSKLTDGAVLVARQRLTKRKQFAEAVESLGQVGAKIIGVVLNDVSRAETAGYGYGYGPATTSAPVAPAARETPERFFPDDRDESIDAERSVDFDATLR